MKNMTLENIAAACSGTYYGTGADKGKEAAGVVIDNRLIEKDYLFIAIKGNRVDGHSFIPAAFEAGALAALSEHELENPAGPYILVESCEAAMKKIAKFYRQSLDIKVVGITGSVGKTSTKEMIASVLSQKYHVLKTEGNFNNEIGLPLTIFRIRDEHEVAVLEMGISDFGEMHRLAEMANPDVCVITNIGLCHLENLIDRDGILKAKTECLEHMRPNGAAILNGDDDKLCTKTEVNGRKTIFYGMMQKPLTIETEEGQKELARKDVYAEGVELIGLDGSKAVIHVNIDQSAAVALPVTIPIAGEHNIYNAMAAAAVGVELGLSEAEIVCGIEAVQTIGGRSNLIHRNGRTIIDDCYNANPVSMKASIDVLSKAEGRKIAVLGDMGELGADEKVLHFSVGEHFAGKGIDMLFVTGELSTEIVSGVVLVSPATEVHYFGTREALIEALKEESREGDTILVKASHFMNFQEIVKAL